MDVTPSDSGIQLLGKTLLEKDFIQIQEIYGDDNFFPLEVRLHLSDWIEEQFIPLVSTGCVDIFDPTHQQMATNTAMGLVQQLDTKVQTMSNDTEKFLTKINLHYNLSLQGTKGVGIKTFKKSDSGKICRRF